MITAYLAFLASPMLFVFTVWFVDRKGHRKQWSPMRRATNLTVCSFLAFCLFVASRVMSPWVRLKTENEWVAAFGYVFGLGWNLIFPSLTLACTLIFASNAWLAWRRAKCQPIDRA